MSRVALFFFPQTTKSLHVSISATVKRGHEYLPRGWSCRINGINTEHKARVHCVSVSMLLYKNIKWQWLRHPFYRLENWDRKGQHILVKIRGEMAI